MKKSKSIQKIIVSTILAFMLSNGDFGSFFAVWLFFYFIQRILGIIVAILGVTLFGISRAKRNITKAMEEDIKNKF